MIAPHVGQHIENDPSVNGGFDIVAFSECGRLERRFLHLDMSPTDASPFFKIAHFGLDLFVLGEGLGSIEDVGDIKVLDIVPGDNVRIASL